MKHRFYRADLPSVVWDPENKRPLAEFVKGEFITEDERTIEKLREMGYPEVEMEATHPPNLPPPPIQPEMNSDVEIGTETEEEAVKEVEKEVEKKVKPKKKTTKKKKAKPKAKKKAVKKEKKDKRVFEQRE